MMKDPKTYILPKLRALAEFCELCQSESDGTFVLSITEAADEIGVDPMTAVRFLGRLKADGLLVIIKAGRGSRTSEYKYLYDSTNQGKK